MSFGGYRASGNSSENAEASASYQEYYDGQAAGNATQEIDPNDFQAMKQSAGAQFGFDMRHEESEGYSRHNDNSQFQARERAESQSLDTHEADNAEDNAAGQVGTFDPRESLLQIPAVPGVSGDQNDDSNPPPVLELAGIGRHGSLYYRAPPRARSAGPHRRGKSPLGSISQIPENENETPDHLHNPARSPLADSREQERQNQDNFNDPRNEQRIPDQSSRGRREASPFEKPSGNSPHDPSQIPRSSSASTAPMDPTRRNAPDDPRLPQRSTANNRARNPPTTQAANPREQAPAGQRPQTPSQTQVPHALRPGPPSHYPNPSASSGQSTPNRPQENRSQPPVQPQNPSRTPPAQLSKANPSQQDPRLAGNHGPANPPGTQHAMQPNAPRQPSPNFPHPAGTLPPHQPQMPSTLGRQDGGSNPVTGTQHATQPNAPSQPPQNFPHPAGNLPPHQPQMPSTQGRQDGGSNPVNPRMERDMQSPNPTLGSAREPPGGPGSAQTPPPPSSLPRGPPQQQQQQQQQQSPPGGLQLSGMPNPNTQTRGGFPPTNQPPITGDWDALAQGMKPRSEDDMMKTQAQEPDPSQKEQPAADTPLTSEMLIHRLLNEQQAELSGMIKPDSSKAMSEVSLTGLLTASHAILMPRTFKSDCERLGGVEGKMNEMLGFSRGLMAPKMA